VTSGDGRPLRLALLLHRADSLGVADPERHVRELADALSERDVAAHVLRPDAGRLRVADALLHRRGFAGPLAPVPFAVTALLAGRYDVAHCFSAADALAALAWRRITGRPVVFTCLEPVDRASLADRRLRLWLLRRAVEDTDAVIASSREVQHALRRWLDIEAPVLASHEPVAHERLYRDLVARRR
jgi:glycosyl transferase family 4